MCGIIGYIGKNEAYPLIINGLKKLEYRGYDSAVSYKFKKKNRVCRLKTEDFKNKISNIK